jgi:hypothetical protein
LTPQHLAAAVLCPRNTLPPQSFAAAAGICYSVPMIQVEAKDKEKFLVTVDEKNGSGRFEVTVSDDYHRKLTGGSHSKEELVRASFAFLLERESASSILSSFELPVIARYFPEYERKIKDYLH